MYRKLEIDFAGRKLSLETGRLARQAHGAVLAQYGDTVVLATVVSAYEGRANVDFLPLTVDYVEKTFAAGKIPGGFFKREGRPSEKEILTSRLIDRAMRPLFPKGYDKETQLVVTVLSVDRENDPDMLSLIAASAALEISDIPHGGPVASVRMGRVGGQIIVNPGYGDLEASDVSLVVAANPDSIMMLEGGAAIVDEETILEALFTAHEEMQPVFAMQRELRNLAGKPKREFAVKTRDPKLLEAVKSSIGDSIEKALAIKSKKERGAAVYAVSDNTVAALADKFPGREKEIADACDHLVRTVVRAEILDNDRRIDDRKSNELRQLSCEVSVLPRTHGSALFTRGETQALATVTLGTSSDEQKIDALLGERYKKFMLHYNFPPFSTGEVKFLRGPGRREIGHGALAERAIAPVLPDEESFPYTIRVVSEVLESNGSSSMATVCGGSLALMDAGVPIKSAVAGIAMGLVKEGDKVRVLTDILGDEDHLGDMDFKVAGTTQGVTAIQMDNKAGGVSKEIMRQALHQARDARLFILGVMEKGIEGARKDVSQYAPRIVTLHIKPDKIREVIGPGGKVIRGLVEETGCKIDIEDDGTVLIASSDSAAMEKAISMIQAITAEPEIGKVYRGKVRKIVEFGAFVEIMPGTDGLLHISQISSERIRRVEDVLHEGDEINVKVLDVDRSGKIRLSMREAEQEKGK
ncbi:MAG: polyribonucleotide nucleotidyltransferase [Candidatus Binatus sp.]|uniref:polyribonucleotide nucleotidyltransferase n=1 Tax=Candidatus Binatus sp. TaxID=2811406 RepID=UPI0027167991|nr:polyribonucleotide nucleotidyltransferase [Candidatus Binatus sp.]MDO8434857.1 polyribonucleotide nucleotidyltransferase [Candidatus Binatus sp.]